MKLLNRRRRSASPTRSSPIPSSTRRWTAAARSARSRPPTSTCRRTSSTSSGRPQSLERLARTYWWFLSRVTLGLVRVHYRDDERAVVFIMRPFVLLRFHPPEYDLSADRGVVNWRIRDGLLVGRKDDGYLEIDVRRCPPEHEGYGTPARRGRGRELLPPPRAAVQVVLRQHAVAHPRDRHARLPQAARAARARGVRRRALRRGGAPAAARGRQHRLDAVARRPRRWPPPLRAGLARRRYWRRSAARPWRCRSAPAASCGRGGSGCAGPCPSASASTSDSVVAPRGPW